MGNPTIGKTEKPGNGESRNLGNQRFEIRVFQESKNRGNEAFRHRGNANSRNSRIQNSENQMLRGDGNKVN